MADGTGVCVYCGAQQKRPAPVTEEGKALRGLYDRYGAKTVLNNGAYLVSGLGDLVGEEKKLRNQLKMAMDAGVGRLYLEQLEQDAPGEDFDRRVKLLLTEEAGLNDKAAGELAGYFDEMIGWRAGAAGRTAPKMRKTSGVVDMDRRAKEAEGENRQAKSTRRTGGNKEVDRTGRYTKTSSETRRGEKSKEQNEKSESTLPLPTEPVPEKEGCGTFLLSLAAFAGTLLLTIYVMPYFVVLALLTGFIVFTQFVSVLTANKTKIMKVSRKGDQVICTWPEADMKVSDKWFIAVDKTWVLGGAHSPACLANVRQGATVTLAYESNGKILFGDSEII